MISLCWFGFMERQENQTEREEIFNDATKCGDFRANFFLK